MGIEILEEVHSLLDIGTWVPETGIVTNILQFIYFNQVRKLAGSDVIDILYLFSI